MTALSFHEKDYSMGNQKEPVTLLGKLLFNLLHTNENNAMGAGVA